MMNMATISVHQSTALTWLRVSAMGLIVSCHLLQAYNNRWAWVLNVGVQIFLAMSGYLYGHKQIRSWPKWFFSRFKKLYIPYFLFLLVVLPVLAIYTPGSFQSKHILIYILDLQGISGGINGLGHLWFMTAIGLCYLMTPVLQFMRDRHSRILWLLLFTVATVEYAFVRIHLYHFSWLFLYAFGYGYAAVPEKFRRIIDCTLLLLVAGLALFEMNWEVILDYGSWQNRLFHDALGLCLLLGGIRLLQGLRLNRVPPVIRRLDQLSYSIYIVHHIFILGPLSLAFLMPRMSINIAVMLVLSLAAAALLESVSQTLIKRLPN